MYACPFECLAMSLAKANFKGNCYLLNLYGKSFGIIGMRGINTLSPFAMPVITVARTTFGPRCVICSRVAMRSLGTSRLRINSTGISTLISACRKVPLTMKVYSKELKNSSGYDVTCHCPLAYLQIDILYCHPKFAACTFFLFLN
ncbi:hypothetical protein AVEN_38152-1 [Araneus ventricosus]|uniref:Uncharacterized protein n=1 Tax=Araneus ventricosus TaxID=182803 RepID=A0A4Y2F1L4_ARAVE|nr:hypothetical protein AVEN_38152-1 [Araneus ventricosus]